MVVIQGLILVTSHSQAFNLCCCFIKDDTRNLEKRIGNVKVVRKKKQTYKKTYFLLE